MPSSLEFSMVSFAGNERVVHKLFQGRLGEEPRFQMVGVVIDCRDACGVIHKVLSLK